MSEITFLSAMAELGKAALSDAVKESVKNWLTDAVRVKRAIHKTAFAFSTKLPGTEDALIGWVRTDAFFSAMVDLVAGSLPENLVTVDDFLTVTGIGFGAVSRDIVRDMLIAFYGTIREDLVTSRQGLILVDNRLGEALRELNKLRIDFAAQALPTAAQVGIQRISTEILNDVAERQGWGGGLGFGAELHVNLELPPAVQNIVSREATVRAVRDILQTTTWYAMYGGSGSGKTQLAILIAQAFDRPKAWIRLRGPQSASDLILETALTKLAARRPGQSTQLWCEAACLALHSGAIIVLDDLPRTTGDGALDELLAALCAACAHTGVHLITTSSGSLSSGTRAAVENQVYEEAVPSFCEDDIRQLFRAYGAPEPFLVSNWFGFVHGTTARHPVLLIEAARYLQASGWATDDRSFEDLLRGTFASALDIPTVERIRQTLPNETTREFLYRLKVIGSTFGMQEVQRISAVPPPVTFPLDHLASVIGLWVHQDSDREYVLSPLLSRLGDENLPKDLQQAIHLALARGILEERRLGPLKASQAIGHFVAGGDLNSAALVLLVAWQGMLAVSELHDPFALTGIWAHMAIPTKIALEKRIYLRALQVILRRRLGRDDQYELSDLEHLLSEGESDEKCQLAIAVVGVMVAAHLGDKDPELAIRSVRRSIEAIRSLEPPAGIDAELDLRTGVLTLLWMIVAWIQSDAQYQQWFTAVRDLTPDEVRAWTTMQFAGLGSETVCGGLWTRTADLPELDRNWAGVLEQLELLKAWAKSAGVPSLTASALRSEIIVIAEYQRGLPQAEMIARAGMDEFRDLPELKSSIADTIARQYFYFGDPAEATRWFDTAFAHQEEEASAIRVESLTIAGVAAQRFDFDRARRYFEDGVIAAASKRVGVLPRVKARGELGILFWNAGQHHEAYSVWNLAAHELLSARQDTKEWKTLFRLFGNCTGYFDLTAQGMGAQGTDMIAPFTGILLREIADINNLHKPEDDWMLHVQMVMFAESVGAYDDAVDWASKTKFGTGALGTGAQAAVAGALTARDLTELRFAEIVRTADIGDLDEALDADGFAQLDDDGRAQLAARFAARLSLVATVIELARIGLHDRSSSETLANTVAELSRECAARYGGSRLWSGAADVFESLENHRTSWQELWAKAAKARQHGNSALQVMYGIAAIAVAGPSEAVQIQLQIVPWLERVFSPTLYHATVAKFVPEYWRRALDQSPMSFGLLSRTRTAIAKAQALDDTPRVHALLHSAAFSLAVRVPTDVQLWLDANGE